MNETQLTLHASSHSPSSLSAGLVRSGLLSRFTQGTGSKQEPPSLSGDCGAWTGQNQSLHHTVYVLLTKVKGQNLSKWENESWASL